MINKGSKFLIVGLGLIGGSYAIKLKSLGYKVYAIDINKDAINYALDNNYIDATNIKEKELINSVDYIVLCLYPLDNIKWIKENKKYLNKKTIITDVSGVKTNYVDIIQNELIDNEFISMHPMAGKEKSGVYHSDPSIFLEANMLIIKEDKNSEQGVNFAISLAKLLEFKNIEIITSKEHDAVVSFLSQLPHAIAVALMNSHNNNSLHRFSGDSFKDLTRIAKINENLWSELFLLNKDILVKDIDSFIETLNEIKNKIKEEDVDSLKDMFKESTKRRKEFEK